MKSFRMYGILFLSVALASCNSVGIVQPSKGVQDLKNQTVVNWSGSQAAVLKFSTVKVNNSGIATFSPLLDVAPDASGQFSVTLPTLSQDRLFVANPNNGCTGTAQVSDPQALGTSLDVRAHKADGQVVGGVMVLNFIPSNTMPPINAAQYGFTYVDRNVSIVLDQTCGNTRIVGQASLKKGWNLVKQTFKGTSNNTTTLEVSASQTLASDLKWVLMGSGPMAQSKTPYRTLQLF